MRSSLFFLCLSLTVLAGCGGAAMKDSLSECQRQLVEVSREQKECPKCQDAAKIAELIAQPSGGDSTPCPKRECPACNCPTCEQGSGLVLYNLDRNEAVRIIQRGGGVSPDEIDEGRYRFSVDTSTVVLIVGNGMLELFSIWTSPNKKKAETLALEWNAGKRFARVYLDQDGDIFLKSEFLIDTGATEASIDQWLKLYIRLLERFRSELAAIQ